MEVDGAGSSYGHLVSVRSCCLEGGGFLVCSGLFLYGWWRLFRSVIVFLGFGYEIVSGCLFVGAVSCSVVAVV